MPICKSKKYYVVETELGELRGKQSTSGFNGKKYCSFLGIPYAKPPLAELRFLPPEAPKAWQGVYDATYEKHSCYQSPILISIHLGNEDCLYLNVYTPLPPSEINTPLPVMFYIHGGGFLNGSGVKWCYSPDILISRDIILVVINYRLHALGFLNLGIEQCPGNVGLKDQTLALHWVQKNIRNFGGDPNNVTIFGQSAGASSVHYHMISPLSQGLFHKAIMQSGSSFSPWAFTEHPIEEAFLLGRQVGYHGNDRHELLDVLRRITVRELLHAVESVLKQSIEISTKFPTMSPSVETIAEGAFLPDTPKKLMKLMKPIPVIYGQNDREGMLAYLGHHGNIVKNLRVKFSTFMKLFFNINPTHLPQVTEQVKQLYFGNASITARTGNQISNLFTDVYFYRSYEAIDVLMKSKLPPYVYLFTYEGNLNMFTEFIRMLHPFVRLNSRGANHGDEIFYMFYFKKAFFFRRKIKGDDLKVVNHLTSMWTNFASSSNPSTDDIKWKPATTNDLQYLNINARPEMKKGKICRDTFDKLHQIIDPLIDTSD